MTKVVIADPIHEDAKTTLLEAGYDVIDMSTKKDELLSILDTAEVLIVRSATKVKGDFLDACTDLKVIGRPGVGLDNIDLDTCEERGIKVFNSPEGPTRSVAELALGLMIATARKFATVIPDTKDGKWPKKVKGSELFGKTLGIIGTGSIGGTLAKYAISLGMTTLGYDVIQYDEMKDLENFSYVELNKLLEQSDFISVHVPLLPATKHMLDEKEFAKMKDGVKIINTSRGGIINEKSLLSNIKSGKVTGAGLDVYEDEPVSKDNELVNHPLVVTTAHNGAQTPEASRRNSMIIAEKIMDYLN